MDGSHQEWLGVDRSASLWTFSQNSSKDTEKGVQQDAWQAATVHALGRQNINYSRERCTIPPLSGEQCVELGKCSTNGRDDPKLLPGDAVRRLTYARKYPSILWSGVGFLIGKMFTTAPRTGGQNNMVWGERGKAYHKEESKYPPRVMVCLGRNQRAWEKPTSIFKF
jgi:hypothetical protein